jgi:hypothetical protein
VNAGFLQELMGSTAERGRALIDRLGSRPAEPESLQLDQTRRGELHQHLAVRCPRAAEPGRQALPVEPFPRTWCAGDDVVLELIAQRTTHHPSRSPRMSSPLPLTMRGCEY